METRSIFSVNTNQTGFKLPQGTNYSPQSQQANFIHDFYHKLFPSFSKQCPYLSKIFYLQLLLRQNILIYTEDRVDARDIWLSLSRMLDLKKPQIYVVDQGLNMQQLLGTKNQYQRVMLYDVHKLSVDNINKILNSQSQVSILGIQSNAITVGTHISDLFSMMIIYEQEQHAAHLVDTFNQQYQLDSARNFDKKSFNQYVKINFEIVIQQPDEEGFLKPFLSLFQHKLDNFNHKISQSKWKKMLIILKFIGVNKQQGVYKRLCLGDFFFAPELLASSSHEFKSISQALRLAIIEFVPYYGLQKFEKSIKNHFWLSKNHHQMYKNLMAQVEKYSISFFYPCIKFPETACLSPIPTNYQITGYEKKLMSDHHIQIDPTKKFLLKMEIKSDSKMVIHLGIACYDKFKNVILPVQACRRKDSGVQYRSMEGEKIIVCGVDNLQRWSIGKQNFAYERAIGVYFNGQTSQIPSANEIVYKQKQPYSKINRPYEDIIITNRNENIGQIVLSSESRQWFVNYRHLLHKNKSILMNHYEGGVGCIGETLILNQLQWKSVQIVYEGEKFENTGRNFFPSTKYVRVVVMVNYNEGYPSFNIENKNAIFQFKNIVFRPF